MNSVELSFPLVGNSLPPNSGYLISAGIKGCLECLGHRANVVEFLKDHSIGLHLFASQTPLGEIALGRNAMLRIRLAPNLIPNFLPLAGRRIRIGKDLVQLGVPSVQGLTPASHLYARIVTIKGFQEPTEFLAAATRQLTENAISNGVKLNLVLHRNGPHTGTPIRRVLRVRGKTIVGFALDAECDTADDSLRLQSMGIGGRRHFGAGIFTPKLQPRETPR